MIIIMHNSDSDNNIDAVKEHCSGKYKGMVSADRSNLNSTIKLLLGKNISYFLESEANC